MGIEQTVAALRADAEDGALEELCARHDVDLLVLFGSARTSPPTAGDIDLAYKAARGAAVDVLRLLDDLDDPVSTPWCAWGSSPRRSRTN